MPSASTTASLLSTNERLALLAEFRDALLDITETMRVAPGIMQRMPPLPVAMDGALASALLPPPKTFLTSSRFGNQPARSPMTFVPPNALNAPNAPNAPNARTNGAVPNGARANEKSARTKSLRREKDAARVSGKRAPKGAGAAAAPRANKKK